MAFNVCNCLSIVDLLVCQNVTLAHLLLVWSNCFFLQCPLLFVVFSPSACSPVVMPKHKCDMLSSTPRRHSRGSPDAHRTRRQISFARAVQIGLCKICFRVLPDKKSLGTILRVPTLRLRNSSTAWTHFQRSTILIRTSRKPTLGRSFHRRPNLLVQFWCLSCEKRIVQPARHRCLEGASLVVNSGQGTWQCDECQFKATTKVGLDNHIIAHKREAAAAAMSKISIPASIFQKKKSRKSKLDPISSGDPGCARLAPPASPQPIVQTVDESSVCGRADVAIPTVLDCFNEALDTLLEVDEISERFPHFENLVQNISEAVQNHFNLVRPQPNQNTSLSSSKGADLNNPQVVQRGYRWNRRKCIRQITHANSSRCPIPRDVIFSHFEQVWKSSPVQQQLNQVDAPTRPPIVESLARDFVLECLKSYVPNSWKKSNTILIQKSSEPASLSDWRPISLSDTAYKLFSKCLARKLSDWCEVHEASSPAQKGFSPFDGVIEHNFLLREHLETARRGKCERFVAWIDIANAFGSIPHPILLESLLRNGVDQDFVRLVQNIYTNAETQVLTIEGPTAPLPLLSGVKQGCPLSGILFNIAIDVVLRKIQEQQEDKVILAFADDIVILAKSEASLQQMLDNAFTLLQDLRLEVNISKCATLHLSGVTPVGARPSSFKIGDSFLRHLGDHDAYTYLGKPVGFFLQKNFSDVDRFVRCEVKEILSVPVKASNHYLSANKRSGGCSIPSAAEDSDFYLINTAFKLLTSNDEEVALLALAQLSRTVRQRVKRQPSDGDFASFLSGCMDDEFSKTTNRLSNTWTNARKASARQKITWSFSQGKPTISIGDETLSSAHRRKVMRTFHAHFQTKAASALKALPSQGMAMDCVALSTASTHFLTEGKFTRFADWRFIHKARLNLVPLNANKTWKDPQEKLCRRCGRWDETLPHVINHCPMHSAAWQKRHNAILKCIQAAVSFKGKVLSVNQVVDRGLRPDLVAEVEKYRPLLKFFQANGWSKVHIVPIILGSLGAWDPINDGFLKKVATKSYLSLLRKLCVSDCIRWSRDIYIHHITGVQQYGRGTIEPAQIVGIQEQAENQSNESPASTAKASPCSEPPSVDCSQSMPILPPPIQSVGASPNHL
ncbi:retrovirus-related Pol polyprotein from type-1 retrotransposable element R2 [Trichonephila clavata]|uniref:Retrovirus-related Pol polyprotein from type-1 retrotransposable element R2 n=1 Tax=Trichonephila clavata TaxID=2740835 RepID=A0A8X6L1G0_TRICU|nr:retrovirus-related Pol polyprotein from type-1 retrotransposable element R2 [Trichonephila clavata]